MTTTTTTQLAALATASEIDITIRRDDGTPGRPTTIWVVDVDGHLYIRSYNGPDGSWYRQARRTGRGQVSAGGHRYDITFTEPDGVDPAAIDAAYRRKYARHGRSYVDAMVNPNAVAATVRLDPTPSEENQR